MKKTMMFVLMFALVIGLVCEYKAEASAKVVFTDVAETAWYYEHVQYVASDPRKIMIGYGDKFGPMDPLTVEQFIKIAITSADLKVTQLEGELWSGPYIAKAHNIGLYHDDEFTDFKRPITRAEMAMIMIRALPGITGEEGSAYNIDTMKEKILDYKEIPDKLKDYVYQSYALGILMGSDDKKFHPNDSLTRAEAATVVSRMLNPEKRAVIKNKQGTEDFWTDEQFEQYIQENQKDHYCIAKIEDRKLYLRCASSPTPTLMDETNTPGINTVIYEAAKHMAYYAKKYGNKFFISYLPEAGGIAYLNYYIDKDSRYTDIFLAIYTEPQVNSYARDYAPGKQKNLSYYQWEIGLLREPGFLENQGWEPGKDRTKFEWTQKKYEEVFLQACKDIYGETQGKAFYEFVMPRYYAIYYAGGIIEDSYFGDIPGANLEVAYYYSHENGAKDKRFCTTKPEARR